jgi:hypothetical protein
LKDEEDGIHHIILGYHFCDPLLVAGIVRLDKNQGAGRTYRSGSTIVEP